MTKTCNVCKQPYPRNLAHCPHCAAQQAECSAGVRSHSDPEVDLGSPTTPCPGAADPASGASAISWEAMIRARAQADGTQDGPVRISSLSKSDICLEQPWSNDAAPHPGEATPHAVDGGTRPTTTVEEAEHSIDLGNPAQTAVESPDPPSGASAYSWAQLLDTAGKGDTALDAPPVRILRSPCTVVNALAVPAAASEAAALAQPSVRRHLLWHWLGGAGVAAVFCVGLWLVGIEPPQRWRQHVQHWLGTGPSEPSAGTRAPP